MHESGATARATHNRRKEENSIVPSSYSPDTGNIGRTLIEEGSRENTHDSTIPTCGSNDAPQGSCRQFSQFPCDNKEDPSVTAWRPSTRPGVRCPECPKECTACRRTQEVKVQRTESQHCGVRYLYLRLFPFFPLPQVCGRFLPRHAAHVELGSLAAFAGRPLGTPAWLGVGGSTGTGSCDSTPFFFKRRLAFPSRPIGMTGRGRPTVAHKSANSSGNWVSELSTFASPTGSPVARGFLYLFLHGPKWTSDSRTVLTTRRSA